MRIPRFRRARLAVPVLAAVCAGVLAVRQGWGSDHQDTPEVELSPRLDINDVYAFPGSDETRIVLVMTTQSPITPAGTAAARFDANALYQIKIDNTGDAVEDLVLQFQFDDLGGGAQRVALFGPVAPATTGKFNRVAKATPDLLGNINTVLTTGAGNTLVQLFAGPRDDPFYIDLDQFFRIIPDRRPSRGPLSQIGPAPEASAFRPKCTGGVPNPGQAQFDQTHGCAADFLRTFNGMAIVVELPEALIKGAGNNVGIWATVSR
ncbi:DUF4331 family protein [Longimicrobium sp.]|uniref:DUF4331 family protein n=1 Tax=Longimicrobium sp. TaxID=2029185 RepID=UPI002CD226CB|nr:DUF4331 family protein [Longimicrobium sp.]HSU16916.1 DUF4331 family protein [Longimicrobium sp.]